MLHTMSNRRRRRQMQTERTASEAAEKIVCSRTSARMTLENYLFGNIQPREYSKVVALNRIYIF